MDKNAEKIAKLLAKKKQAEESLLIKKNKNLPKYLRRLLSIKRKLITLNYTKFPDGPQSHAQE